MKKSTYKVSDTADVTIFSKESGEVVFHGSMVSGGIESQIGVDDFYYDGSRVHQIVNTESHTLKLESLPEGLTVEHLTETFTDDQKIEFIRSAQSIFWTMTSREILSSMNKDELDNFFKLMYKNTPESLLQTTVDTALKTDKLQ